MDQMRSLSGLRQPSRGKTICVRDLHSDCACAKCRPFAEAAEADKPAALVGDPLGRVLEPTK